MEKKESLVFLKKKLINFPDIDVDESFGVPLSDGSFPKYSSLLPNDLFHFVMFFKNGGTSIQLREIIKKSRSLRDIFRELPSMASHLEILNDKILDEEIPIDEIQSTKKCEKCGGGMVVDVKQNRAADEAASIYSVCRTCGQKNRI